MKNDVRLKGQLRLYMLWPAIMGILLLALNIWIFMVDGRAGLVMSVFLVVYIIVVAILYTHNKSLIMTQLVDFAAQYGLVQNVLLNDLSVPYAIMLADGKLVWTNNSFAKLFGGNSLTDKYLSNFIHDLNRSVFPKEEGEKLELEVVYNERDYLAKLSRLSVQDSLSEDASFSLPKGREYFVVVSLTDITELKRYMRENEDQRLVSGLIYIDNYDEVMESVEVVRQSLLIALIDR